MKKVSMIMSILFLVGMVLVGCGQVKSPDERAVRALVEQQDLVSFMQDGEEIATIQSTVEGERAELLGLNLPISARYIHVELKKTVDQVMVNSETGTAVANMTVVYRGKFELLNLEGEVITTRDVVIQGQVNYTAQKENGQWKIVDMSLLVSTGETAPVIGEIALSPEKVKVNQWVTIEASLGGVGVNDLVIAVAQNPLAGIRAGLWDDHILTIGDVQGDGVYTGATYVRTNAVVGKHIGVVKAICFGNLLNPAREVGSPIPVTFAMKTFSAEVID